MRIWEESPTAYLCRLITGLSIPGVGKQTAWILAAHFDSLRPLMKANLMELEAVEGIAERRAIKIWEYFQNDKNIEEVKGLMALGIAY